MLKVLHGCLMVVGWICIGLMTVTLIGLAFLGIFWATLEPGDLEPELPYSPSINADFITYCPTSVDAGCLLDAAAVVARAEKQGSSNVIRVAKVARAAAELGDKARTKTLLTEATSAFLSAQAKGGAANWPIVNAYVAVGMTAELPEIFVGLSPNELGHAAKALAPYGEPEIVCMFADRVAQEHPRHRVAKVACAKALVKAGQFDEARRVASPLPPNYRANVLSLIGAQRARAGDITAALDDWEDALRSDAEASSPRIRWKNEPAGVIVEAAVKAGELNRVLALYKEFGAGSFFSTAEPLARAVFAKSEPEATQAVMNGIQGMRSRWWLAPDWFARQIWWLEIERAARERDLVALARLIEQGEHVSGRGYARSIAVEILADEDAVDDALDLANQAHEDEARLRLNAQLAIIRAFTRLGRVEEALAAPVDGGDSSQREAALQNKAGAIACELARQGHFRRAVTELERVANERNRESFLNGLLELAKIAGGRQASCGFTRGRQLAFS